MEQLPKDIVEIIYDYKHSAEHYDMFRKVRRQIIHTYWITRKLLVNYQFRSLFFPDFFSSIIMMQPQDDDEDASETT